MSVFILARRGISNSEATPGRLAPLQRKAPVSQIERLIFTGLSFQRDDSASAMELSPISLVQVPTYAST